MAQPRTDLALEASRISGGERVPGVEQTRFFSRDFPVTSVAITTPEGADALGKPMGTYLTLELQGYRSMGADALPRAIGALGELLGRLIPEDIRSALVVGLGNRSVTPDAVGPRAADHVLVTRHLRERDPERFGDFFPVAALAAGVLGTTGVESGVLVQAVVEKIRPDLVLAVDALAARGLERLCATVQIADSGIIPGSGVGNARKALNRETLGVPVVALGVPTAVDGATLAQEFGGDADGLESALVTPKDVDVLVTELARVVGYGINTALQPGLTVADMDYFLS